MKDINIYKKNKKVFMRNLKELLEKFELTEAEHKSLFEGSTEAPKAFKEIAAALLGGHFVVTSKKSEDDKVWVTPTCVEIYYHEEGDKEDRIKDYIVYHRNKTNIQKPRELEVIPYGVLHNHQSGIDITFEQGGNPKTAIRASALIREFKIKNGKNTKCFELKDTDIEDRSTYIYAALYSQFNIFDGFSVEWEDGAEDIQLDKPSLRKNVYKYEGEEKTKGKDERKWQFRIKQEK